MMDRFIKESPLYRIEQVVVGLEVFETGIGSLRLDNSLFYQIINKRIILRCYSPVAT